MKYLKSVVLIGLFSLSSAVTGQEVMAHRQKSPAVIVPREIASISIISQPDSPLKFEDVTAVRFLDGGGERIFRLYNQSAKPIRSYIVAECLIENNRDGLCNTVTRQFSSNSPLLPGQSFPRPEDNEANDFNVIPLTDALRAKLSLQRASTQAVIILMIVKTEFADGTAFSDESVFKALKNFCDKNE